MSRDLATQRARALMFVVVKREVEILVKRDRLHSLDFVMEATGYISNMSNHTSQDLGDAIIALAQLIPLERIAHTVEAVVFERVIRRSNRSDEVRGSACEAQEAARRALAECGVALDDKARVVLAAGEQTRRAA